MLDIKWIRENPDELDIVLRKRNASPCAAQVIDWDKRHRAVKQEMQELQARRNSLAEQIAAQRGNRELEEEAVSVKNTIQQLKISEEQLEQQLRDILVTLPNIPLADVPVGADESANKCVRVIGDTPKFDFKPLEHWDIGKKLGIMDFEIATKISGSRFSLLRRAGALLERALKNFMIESHVQQHGYEEVSVPFLVKSDCMLGTGQLPKFAEDSFRTTDDRWLIPTAEVPLTNIVRDEVIPVSMLPMRFTAYSACFRSEAGAAGRDTRGMIRNHQFSKVEMVSIVHPDNGEAELERMTAAAEDILKKLGLAYRVMLLSSGDMGFSARKTYDLEVWLPSCNSYREISSCSLCGDFQARRMNARYSGGGQKGYVATLNGSGLAIGRTIVAILENYQREDGSVKVPSALIPYMNGLEEITNGE